MPSCNENVSADLCRCSRSGTLYATYVSSPLSYRAPTKKDISDRDPCFAPLSSRDVQSDSITSEHLAAPLTDAAKSEPRTNNTWKKYCAYRLGNIRRTGDSMVYPLAPYNGIWQAVDPSNPVANNFEATPHWPPHHPDETPTSQGTRTPLCTAKNAREQAQAALSNAENRIKETKGFKEFVSVQTSMV